MAHSPVLVLAQISEDAPTKTIAGKFARAEDTTTRPAKEVLIPNEPGPESESESEPPLRRRLQERGTGS